MRPSLPTSRRAPLPPPQPYNGDASFLAPPTENTKVLGKIVDDLCHLELEKVGSGHSPRMRMHAPNRMRMRAPGSGMQSLGSVHAAVAPLACHSPAMHSACRAAADSIPCPFQTLLGRRAGCGPQHPLLHHRLWPRLHRQVSARPVLPAACVRRT